MVRLVGKTNKAGPETRCKKIKEDNLSEKKTEGDDDDDKLGRVTTTVM